MRVLFTTPVLEHPPAGGPPLRVENSIKALSRVCQLDIIHRAYEPTPEVDATDIFYRGYAEEYSTIYVSVPNPSHSRLHFRFRRLIDRIIKKTILQHTSLILDHVDRRQIDVVWFGYGNISYSLIREVKKRRPKLKVVCDTDSVWSRFVLRELPYAKGLRKLKIYLSGIYKKNEERSWADLCDVTAAVSEIDAQYYRDLSKDARKVHLFSNVIDAQSYVAPMAAPVNFKKPSVYLAGTFGHYHSPMDTAARWVLEEVLPIVWAIRPDVHFYIVGRNSDKGFGHLNGPNITVTGKLESVLPYLKNADIALVPLMFESGTRFKILEAGACGVPLVSTTLGAEGIPVKDGEHILLADTPKDFASAILRLLEDKKLAHDLAENCHNLVNQTYSVEALAEEAKEILEYLNHD
jgi:glycosyltransferase involved in cell wall biosynthesis